MERRLLHLTKAGSTAASHGALFRDIDDQQTFGVQANALAAQPSAKVPAPARLVQIAVTAVERQPEVAYPLARLLSVQVSSRPSAQLSLLLGGLSAPAV